MIIIIIILDFIYFFLQFLSDNNKTFRCAYTHTHTIMIQFSYLKIWGFATKKKLQKQSYDWYASYNNNNNTSQMRLNFLSLSQTEIACSYQFWVYLIWKLSTRWTRDCDSFPREYCHSTYKMLFSTKKK